MMTVLKLLHATPQCISASRTGSSHTAQLRRVADRAMCSLHEAFETVLQFLEVSAAEPARLASPLALAAVRTLGRCEPMTCGESGAHRQTKCKEGIPYRIFVLLCQNKPSL